MTMPETATTEHNHATLPGDTLPGTMSWAEAVASGEGCVQAFGVSCDLVDVGS